MSGKHGIKQHTNEPHMGNCGITLNIAYLPLSKVITRTRGRVLGMKEPKQLH